MKLFLTDPGLKPQIIEVGEGDILAYLNANHMSGYTFAQNYDTPQECWSRTINCRKWDKGSISGRVRQAIQEGGHEYHPADFRELEYEGLDVEGMIDFCRELSQRRVLRDLRRQVRDRERNSR